MRPFQRVPFAELPERPRRPHPYLEATARDVVVESAHFGRVRVHVREHGDGPPLLLVHGLMTTGYSFRYLLDLLGPRYRLVIPDLPGAGRSDKPDVAYPPEALAAFVGELVSALGLRGCRAMGNSLGGYLCLRHALVEPGTFSRLSVVHAPAFPIARLRALAAALAVPGTRALVRKLIARDPERWVWRNVHYFDETLKSREETREYGAPLSTVDGVRAFLRYLGDTMRPSGFAAFARELAERRAAPLPLQLIYSRRDPLVPPVTGERLHALLPDARMDWLDATSHFAHVDSPERVAPLLADFFAGAAPPSTSDSLSG